MGISSGPMTLKFWQSPHFQNCDYEKGKFFSPDRCSKMVKFAKNDWCTDCSGKRWANFIFPLYIILDDFFLLLSGRDITILLVFQLFITYSLLARFIQHHKIDVFTWTQCTVGHHVWLSQEKIFVTDLGHTILIFAAKCRVIEWYKWINGQEIEFWSI